MKCQICGVTIDGWDTTMYPYCDKHLVAAEAGVEWDVIGFYEGDDYGDHFATFETMEEARDYVGTFNDKKLTLEIVMRRVKR